MLSVIKRFITYCGLLIGLLLLSIWAMSPTVLRPTANDVLAAYDISLTDNSTVRINPFFARVTVDELAVKTPADEPPLAIRQAVIDISWLDLVNGKLLFDRLTFDGIRLEIEQRPEGLLIGGFNTAALSVESDVEITEPEPNTEPVDYHVLIPELLLSDVLIQYKDALGTQRLQLDTLTLANASITPAKQHFKLDVKAAVNNAPLAINLGANLTEYYGPVRVAFELNNFDLQTVAPFTQEFVDQLQGFASLTTHIEWEANDASYQNFYADVLDTHISLKDFLVATADYEYTTAQQSFSLDHLWLQQQTDAELLLKTGVLTLAEPTQFSVTDNTLQPPFMATLGVSVLNAGPVDISKPDEAIPFKLVGSDAEYASFEFEGWLKPLAEKLSMQLKANVKELPLPMVSPYLADSLGLALKTGQFDTDIDVNIIDEQISGQTHIDLRGLKLDKASDFSDRNLADGKAMSLNTALGVLQDKQGNVSLDIPLSGDINAPGFGTRAFIGLIVKKAAMAKAKDYLVSTFLPYADVIKVAAVAGSYALKVRVEPLYFEPGQRLLSPKQDPFLTQLSQLLLNDEKKQLKLCSFATPADIGLSASELSASQIQQLNALSAERVKQLKRYLVEAGIKSARILLCTPSINKAADAKPQVKLTIN